MKNNCFFSLILLFVSAALYSQEESEYVSIFSMKQQKYLYMLPDGSGIGYTYDAPEDIGPNMFYMESKGDNDYSIRANKYRTYFNCPGDAKSVRLKEHYDGQVFTVEKVFGGNEYFISTKEGSVYLSGSDRNRLRGSTAGKRILKMDRDYFVIKVMSVWQDPFRTDGSSGSTGYNVEERKINYWVKVKGKPSSSYSFHVNVRLVYEDGKKSEYIRCHHNEPKGTENRFLRRDTPRVVGIEAHAEDGTSWFIESIEVGVHNGIGSAISSSGRKIDKTIQGGKSNATYIRF